MDYNITYRQKDKGWQFIISKKENGKWKQVKSKQGFKTKKEAKPAAEKVLEELKKLADENNSIINDNYSEITFKHLSDLFIEHSTLYKEYETIKGYKSAISSLKGLNDVKVMDIRKIHIQKCVDNMIKNELVTNTVKTYLRRIKLVFDYYIDNYNSNFKIDIKSVKVQNDKKVPNKKALTNDEVNKLLKNIANSKFYIVAFIAVKCGLRSGEVLGLTWDDVDFNNKTLSVKNQWKIDKKTRKSCFGSLKGKNSYRVVPISEKTIGVLKKYKQSSYTDIYNRIAPFNAASIEKYLNPLLRKYAGISLHELRHTFATNLIANGIDLKTAAKILGHDIVQTMKTYSHVNDEMMNNASKVIYKNL